jgi:hypothetical protein
MVLTAAQTTAFFENAAQMAIPNATVLQLVAEGIDSVDDLSEFDKDTISQIASNLRRPAAGNHYVFGAKSQKRLAVACEIVRYYETVGRPLTAANLAWNTVIKNFEIQWKALKTKKAGDEPETPKITKGLNIMKWSDSFFDFLNRCIGVRMIPLVYVVRAEENPPAITALAPGQPHSADAGCIERELIDRASHNHPLFRDDSATVYYKLEEATRGTTFSASIKPFQRTKDGRGAYNAIINQFAGEDKWEAEIKAKEALLHSILWKGQSNYSLERHCASHRAAYISLVACAEHVAYQLPNEHSRVGYLLDGIQNNDPGLQAAMANVRSSKGPGEMRGSFEQTVAHILPYDPVAKKRVSGTKRGPGEISDVTGDAKDANVSSFGAKSGRGPKTGVHLRCHKYAEFKALNDAERKELTEWRSKQDGKTNKHGADHGKKSVNFTEKTISAVVDKRLKEKEKAETDSNTKKNEAEALIVSCLQKMISGGEVALPKKSTAMAGATKATNTKDILHSILGRAKNPLDGQ